MSSNFLELGGLAQITSLPGGSKTQFALSCLAHCFAPPSPTPPVRETTPFFGEGNLSDRGTLRQDTWARRSPSSEAPPLHGFSSGYYAFISDEGCLYPEALAQTSSIPLSRLLLVKSANSEDSWKVGLEAMQTGLFSWIFLRPSRPCHATHLRKLQLAASRTQTRCFILSKTKLPHWMFKLSLEVSSGLSPGKVLKGGSRYDSNAGDITALES